MSFRKVCPLLLLSGFLAGTHLSAQNTIGLNIDSGNLTLKNSDNATLLSGGVAGTVGDGDVLQFGYYTTATASNPFSGTWVPLTGLGGANSAFASTSIGDNPDAVGLNNTNGTFALTSSGSTSGDTYLTFSQGSSTSGVSLPNAGQIMAVRFYNGTTVGNSTFYGAVSNPSWTWIAPSSAPATMNFSLNDSGTIWLDNNTAFTGSPASVMTFPEWTNSYNLSSNPAATPENDGVPNLLKYLYDITPTRSMSAADWAALPNLYIDTTTDPGTTYLTIVYRQNAFKSDITVNLQSSPDLQTWTTVTPDISRQAGTDAITGDPIMEVGVIVSTNATKLFIRLNVTQP